MTVELYTPQEDAEVHPLPAENLETEVPFDIQLAKALNSLAKERERNAELRAEINAKDAEIRAWKLRYRRKLVGIVEVLTKD